MRQEGFVQSDQGAATMLVHGGSLSRSLWTVFTERVGLAFGLILGIALLSALAFTARPNVKLVWFDEKGHVVIGVRQMETEERLAQAQHDVEQLRRSLAKQRARNQLVEHQPTGDETTVAVDVDRENVQNHEYRATCIGDQAFLPLRDRLDGPSRTLKAIPSHAAGIFSPCKLVVYGDAVFVEASYQGTTGWLSGYYLTAHR
jgi:hypothetical protein